MKNYTFKEIIIKEENLNQIIQEYQSSGWKLIKLERDGNTFKCQFQNSVLEEVNSEKKLLLG